MCRVVLVACPSSRALRRVVYLWCRARARGLWCVCVWTKPVCLVLLWQLAVGSWLLLLLLLLVVKWSENNNNNNNNNNNTSQHSHKTLQKHTTHSHDVCCVLLYDRCCDPLWLLVGWLVGWLLTIGGCRFAFNFLLFFVVVLPPSKMLEKLKSEIRR